jgi:RNA polymerase sigma-70 factor, ECF subfamily
VGNDGIGDFAERLIRDKARQLVGEEGFSETDYEDLVQDMKLDLWRRLSKFDPGKAPRSMFTASVVKHCVATVIESRKASCRDYRRCRCSLNDPLKTPDSKPAERGDMLDQDVTLLRTGGAKRPAAERIDLRNDIRTVLAGLPPELRSLCCRLMKRTPTEVEEDTGIARGTLYESIQKIRRRFEKAKLKEYL